MKSKRVFTQYSCAVLLIISSILIAVYEVRCSHDIQSGVLMYIAQAFLLAASIFGLDYYIRKLTEYVKDNK